MNNITDCCSVHPVYPCFPGIIRLIDNTLLLCRRISADDFNEIFTYGLFVKMYLLSPVVIMLQYQI